MNKTCGRDNQMYHVSDLSNLDVPLENEVDQWIGMTGSPIRRTKGRNRYNKTHKTPMGFQPSNTSFNFDAKVHQMSYTRRGGSAMEIMTKDIPIV